MARERRPLIRPPQPLWAKAAWTGVAALAAYFAWSKSRPPELPGCDAAIVKSDLANLLKAAGNDALETRSLRTLSSTSEAMSCAATVSGSNGAEIPIEFAVRIESGAPKVEITSGEDRLAPPEAEAPAQAEAPPPPAQPAQGEGCRRGAAAAARLADCDKIIDDKDRKAEARAEALTLRGQAFREGKDWDRALADFTAAIALHSKEGAGFSRQSPIYVERGSVYVAKGDHKNALADFTAAVRTDPENGAAYLGRACEWASAGALAKAEADLKRAATLTKDAPDAACSAALDALRAKKAKRRK